MVLFGDQTPPREEADMSTVFELIAKGDIPCHKVWEDDDHLAFLDINPRVEDTPS